MHFKTQDKKGSHTATYFPLNYSYLPDAVHTAITRSSSVPVHGIKLSSQPN